ncbi:MAG: ABC transporter permease [Candidatus Lambdaproteobacteria bacterium]|nr:ABC transporter permease [Candidatus Lambdaproteobacteria bacterium]
MKQLVLAFKRLLWFIPTVVGLIVIVFIISRIIPADPVALVAGETATPAQVEVLRAKLGLDKPLPIQLLKYFQGLLQGDMGRSLYTTRAISADLLHRLPATIELTLAAMLVTIVLGIPLGVISAIRRNSWLDHVLRVITVSGLAIASFWLGIMLQLLFAMRLGALPLAGRMAGFPPDDITGMYTLDALLTGELGIFAVAASHLTLPALTLAFPALATVVRFTRAGVLDVAQSNFVLYERAMGFPAPVIVWKYVLRNALISTVTQIGLLFGILLAGTVVIETVFDWPGIGNYAVNSIIMSDYNAIMGFTIWAGVIFIVVNLAVDIVQTFIDPRETA